MYIEIDCDFARHYFITHGTITLPFASSINQIVVHQVASYYTLSFLNLQTLDTFSMLNHEFDCMRVHSN